MTRQEYIREKAPIILAGWCNMDVIRDIDRMGGFGNGYAIAGSDGNSLVDTAIYLAGRIYDMTESAQ